mgnify:CR=1 FL=1
MIVICLLTIDNNNQIKAQNTNEYDVIIQTETKKLYTKEAQVVVKIIANNKDIINENTYLSYHVYDNEGEVVLFENKRVPINIDKTGKIMQNLSIDLKSISNKEIKNGAIIKFDIVDEKKSYWFSRNNSIRFDASVIKFENNYLKRIYMEMQQEIARNKIIFSINLLCCIVLAIGICEIKKRHVFE